MEQKLSLVPLAQHVLPDLMNVKTEKLEVPSVIMSTNHILEIMNHSDQVVLMKMQLFDLLEKLQMLIYCCLRLLRQHTCGSER